MEQVTFNYVTAEKEFKTQNLSSLGVERKGNQNYTHLHPKRTAAWDTWKKKVRNRKSAE